MNQQIHHKKVLFCVSVFLEEYLKNAKVFLSTEPFTPQTKYNICKGIHIILHIFKIILIKTEDLQKTVMLVSKAQHIYFEFLKQINQSLNTDLNMVSVIQYIIEKIIPKENTVLFSSLDFSVLDNLIEWCNEFLNLEENLGESMISHIDEKISSIKKGEMTTYLRDKYLRNIRGS